MSFSLTPKQLEGRKLLAGPQRHTLLYGGSRSGKTFLIVYAECMRAIRAPGSRHLMARHHNIDVRQAVMMDTFPKVMRLRFPGVSYTLNKSDQFAAFPNGSEYWFTGLDDKERVDKILGKEFASIAVNECSQVAYATIETLRTRLAQVVTVPPGNGRPETELPLRMYYDLNPAGKAHWSYKEFIEGVKPTGEKVRDPAQFAHMVINPSDNPLLSQAYLDELAGLSARKRKRFLDGQYLSDVPGAFWTSAMIEKSRISEALPSEMHRIVVAVDPPISADENSDECGIVAVGVKGQGPLAKGYVLADRSLVGTPLEWAKRAVQLYLDLKADRLVIEKNQGGLMAEQTLKTAGQALGFPHLPIKSVWASKSKDARAEPVAALYEKNAVHHVGVFPELEDQLTSWVPGESNSPDRLDALVWALTELMLGKEITRTAEVVMG